MGPWPLARFGAAAEWIGRRDALTFPLIGALNAELVRQTQVVLGCDLESIGLVTEVDATDAEAIERGARGTGMASGLPARKFFEVRAQAAAAHIRFTAMVQPSGNSYAIERAATGKKAVSELPDRDASELATRLAPLQRNVDHVVEHWSPSTAGVRLGAITDDRAAVAEVLARSRVDRAQQTYFADTAAVWTKWDPNIIVRVGVTAAGVADEVGLVFRNIPGEHLVRAWRTFRPRADHAQRLGGFVAAMGVENADRFELRLQRSGEPVLEATFVPADTPFAKS